MQFEKLKSNGDFRRLYGRGKSFVSPNVVIYIMSSRKDRVRLGITAGKKIGGAVQRNRAKRLIYAAFRECLPHLNSGVDVVAVARTKILTAKSSFVAKDLKKQFTVAGLWCDYESDK